MKQLNVGLMGAGNISNAYIKGVSMFDVLNLVAIADLDEERARAKAGEHGVAKAYSPEALLADKDIDMVINLTIPAAHAQVSLQALEAGKHVYSEKPLAIKVSDGKRLVETAEASNLALGCAPDTFLGGGIQTSRKLIDEGAIGKPISASAFMLGHGVETWHPNPFFFFQYGGHPLFDMGPYYLTALVNLLGPIKSVVGLTQTGIPQRIISSQPHAGKVIEVDAPIHSTALLEFSAGQAATMIVSGEVVASELPRIEIYGDEGTLSVPDPNTFDGPVKLKTKGKDDWEIVSLSHGYTDNSRGLGAADLASAVLHNRPARASAQLAFHVLESMQSIQDAAEQRKYIDISSTVGRPTPLAQGLKPGQIE